jgi:hypothetical protein
VSGPVPRLAPAGALVASLAMLGGGCAELPVQSRGPEPAATARSAMSSQEPSPGCAAQARPERLQAIRRAVDALPAAAALPAQTRLHPALNEAQGALAGGREAGLERAMRQFIADVEALRLRAPFEQREALVTEAECLIGGGTAAARGATS